MSYYRTPLSNGRRNWKKFQYQAFDPQELPLTPDAQNPDPPDPEPDPDPIPGDVVFMSSLTVTPYLTNFSDTSDVEIADIFIEEAGTYQIYAMMGSGHTTATTSIKVKDSTAATTYATLTAAGQVQQRGPSASFTISSVPTYLRIYATNSNTTASVMVRAITITTT